MAPNTMVVLNAVELFLSVVVKRLENVTSLLDKKTQRAAKVLVEEHYMYSWMSLKMRGVRCDSV